MALLDEWWLVGGSFLIGRFPLLDGVPLWRWGLKGSGRPYFFLAVGFSIWSGVVGTRGRLDEGWRGCCVLDGFIRLLGWCLLLHVGVGIVKCSGRPCSLWLLVALIEWC